MEELVKKFNLPKATKEEIEKWNYKIDLYTSPSFLVGKKLIYKNELIGNIDEIIYKKFSKFYIYLKSGDKLYDLTNSCFEFFNPYYQKNEIISLHPTRKGKQFWSKGFVLNEYDYKSEYYKTSEYRNKYEKSLNENNESENWMTAPIHSDKIKNKIQNTMLDNYGVEYFLKRGNHYSAITETMIQKHGVENIFFDTTWQKTNSLFLMSNIKETSQIEQDICEKLCEIGFKKSYFKGSVYGQKFVSSNNSYYKIDFYNEDYNMVVEVQGDYWHCNPKIYKDDYFNKTKKKTAKEIWEKDNERKLKIINELHCSYYEIWEQDWKLDENKCVDFFKKIIKNENIKS